MWMHITLSKSMTDLTWSKLISHSSKVERVHFLNILCYLNNLVKHKLYRD